MLTGFFEFLAILAAGSFAGAAVYINLVEHPARLAVDLQAAVAQWRASYPLAVKMQVPLGVVAAVAGLAAWALGASALWLLGAATIFSVIPFTLVVIMPLNQKLHEPTRYGGDAMLREQMRTWGRLHAVRSGLSLLATAFYVLAAVSD